MLLNIGVLLIHEHAGSHVLILDALVGQHRRGQAAVQIHVLQTPNIQLRDLVVAFPELFQFLEGHTLELPADFLRMGKERRQITV